MRYIDADKFIKQFERALETQQKYGLYPHAEITQYVIKAIENEPTADVVPKSELDAEHNRWLRLVGENNMLENKLYFERQEVSTEIFEEIEELAKIYTFPVVKNGVVEIAKEPFWCIEPNDLAKLKKKYTEETE